VPLAFFTSDLHGNADRYRTLWERAAQERPAAVFLGGDLMPHGMDPTWHDTDGGFVEGFLAQGFADLRRRLGDAAPRVFLVLGNDDPHGWEADLRAGQERGLWEYVHGRGVAWGEHTVWGYNCVPPTPFLLKDWERYDVSRFVDPGCIAPEDGRRTDGMTKRELRWRTIAGELADMVGGADLSRDICLFHTPPHGTPLDLAALAGRRIDHVPVDPHVGSIAVSRFITGKQPLVTLHGHVHEAAETSGVWRVHLGNTHSFAGAHGGPELPLVRFDPRQPAAATRELVTV
jgi:Icc-related predicted phosphoesterase